MVPRCTENVFFGNNDGKDKLSEVIKSGRVMGDENEREGKTLR